MFAAIIRENKSFKNVNLIFEYRLIDHSGFCDLVVIGQKANNPCVYIIELKEWDNNRKCIPYCNADNKAVKGKILYNGNNVVNHPSAQVEGYVKSCKNKHSAVTMSDIDIAVVGRVFFPCFNDETIDGYRQKPNHNLVKDYSVFNSTKKLADDILKFIDSPDPDFLKKFSFGTYAQGTDLKSWAENALRKFMNDGEAKPPFTLIDTQETAYNDIVKELEKSIKDTSNEKKVFIIEGEPGSGKTAVAINLLLEALSIEQQLPDDKYTRNILFASSSTNEKTWKNTFSGKDCKDLIVKDSMFNPGFNSTSKNEISRLFEKSEYHYLLDDEIVESTGERKFNRKRWREIWDVVKNKKIKGVPCEISDNMYFLTIADEAHSQVACYDEDRQEEIRFTSKGWTEAIGPQAFYVMYTSQITLFLMEDKQGFTDKEATKVENIKKLARELEVKEDNIKHFKLTEQYRCGQSTDYIKWVEKLLCQKEGIDPANKPETKDSITYFKNKNGDNSFSIQVTDYPSDMEKILRKYLDEENASMRLISSYSVLWKSHSEPHGTSKYSAEAKQGLAPEKQDFYLEDRDGKYWNRVWNTKDQFVMPIENKPMQEYPLCEVGYPQEIRGWDFNYFGILWLDDLLWRNGRWGLRANLIEDRPFSGKAPTKDDPDPLWVGPILDRALFSCCKKANYEAIEIYRTTDDKKQVDQRKKIEKQIMDLRKESFVTEEDAVNAATKILDLKKELAEKRFAKETVIFKSESTPCINDLIDRVLAIYRILLTRALKGNVIYVKDPETREHLRDLLK